MSHICFRCGKPRSESSGVPCRDCETVINPDPAREAEVAERIGLYSEIDTWIRNTALWQLRMLSQKIREKEQVERFDLGEK